MTINNCYQILGHVLHQFIKHLKNPTQRLKVSDTFYVPRINEYKTYWQYKAHRIVSWSAEKLKFLDEHFHCVIYNIIQFNSMMNKNK